MSVSYLVAGETVLLVLLTLVLVGLLRTHADILARLTALEGAASQRLMVEPTLPSSDSTVARIDTIHGFTPDLEEIELSIGASGKHALLAFLSTGCLTCWDFWNALASDDRPVLPDSVELIIVAKDRAEENLARLREAQPTDYPVVMASSLWEQLAVPGSPYFALIHGSNKQMVGAGSARAWPQVMSLLHDALDEQVVASETTAGARGRRSRHSQLEHEEELLAAAGITSGHPSLTSGAPHTEQDRR